VTVLPACGWLVTGDRVREIARWWSATAVPHNPDASGSRMWLAVAGELLAADALTAPERSLELADVICSASSRPLTWPQAILDRYPGCVVAAAPARDGGYLVAARADRPGTVIYFFQNEPRLRVAAARPGPATLVRAAFIHSWLAAGWLPAGLDQSHLATIASDDGGTARPVTRIQVAFYCEVCEFPDSPMRREIAPASGASMAE
jgi:hypothetical protein